MDANDPLKELDFVPHVDCQCTTVSKWWFLPARRKPCKARAELLVRIHHYPARATDEFGDHVNACHGAQTPLCLEHAHDFYNEQLEPLVEFLEFVGRCPGCNTEVDDEDDVYELERL